MRKTASSANLNYPEMLERVIVVNAPFLFASVWPMIKMVLPKETMEKITVLGSGYEKELLELIDKENLPTFLG